MTGTVAVYELGKQRDDAVKFLLLWLLPYVMHARLPRSIFSLYATNSGNLAAPQEG